jgi:hypothetical protein
VNSIGHIWLRKTVAVIFFAALAFIYAEKAIHKHSCSSVEKSQASVTQNYNYAICTLCDFQPVSASEVPFIAESAVPVKFIFRFFAPEKLNYFFGSVALINGRGPPVAG